MTAEVKDNIRIEKMNLKDKDIECSKQMVKIDKLNMIKNEYRRLNMVEEEDKSDLNATNMSATGMSMANAKVTESLLQNNFLYYKMCDNLID